MDEGLGVKNTHVKPTNWRAYLPVLAIRRPCALESSHEICVFSRQRRIAAWTRFNSLITRSLIISSFVPIIDPPVEGLDICPSRGQCYGDWVTLQEDCDFLPPLSTTTRLRHFGSSKTNTLTLVPLLISSLRVPVQWGNHRIACYSRVFQGHYGGSPPAVR